MGLAAGGRMTQSIYPDPHGLEVWNQDRCTRVFVHLVSSEMWQAVTGERAPSTPVSAKVYKEHGLPWFELYDEHKGDIKPAKKLKKVKSVAQQDGDHGFDVQDDSHIQIAPADVIGLPVPAAARRRARTGIGSRSVDRLRCRSPGFVEYSLCDSVHVHAPDGREWRVARRALLWRPRGGSASTSTRSGSCSA